MDTVDASLVAVRRLEERGVLTCYRATVDPAALGLGLTARTELVGS